MGYVEEREFTFRIEARREFPDDYEGEEDGFVWTEELRALVAEMLRGMMAATAKHPAWKCRTANRGRSSEDEVTLVLEKSGA